MSFSHKTHNQINCGKTFDIGFKTWVPTLIIQLMSCLTLAKSFFPSTCYITGRMVKIYDGYED